MDLIGVFLGALHEMLIWHAQNSSSAAAAAMCAGDPPQSAAARSCGRSCCCAAYHSWPVCQCREGAAGDRCCCRTTHWLGARCMLCMLCAVHSLQYFHHLQYFHYLHYHSCMWLVRVNVRLIMMIRSTAQLACIHKTSISLLSLCFPAP
jgi:hypothetical protein